MAPEPRTRELYRPGDTVPVSGEYELVDDQGSMTDYDYIMLDEGETFPEVPGEENIWFELVESSQERGGSQS